MQNIIVKFGKHSYSNDNDIVQLVMYIVGKGSNEVREKILAQGTRGLSREPKIAAEQLIRMQERVNKATKRRVLHLIISFSKDCTNTEAITAYAADVANRFGEHFQLIYAVHSSTDNIHIHYAINRICVDDGYKMHWSRDSFNYIREFFVKLGEHYLLNYCVSENEEELYHPQPI